jgi:hypothetical protein
MLLYMIAPKTYRGVLIAPEAEPSRSLFVGAFKREHRLQRRTETNQANIQVEMLDVRQGSLYCRVNPAVVVSKGTSTETREQHNI